MKIPLIGNEAQGRSAASNGRRALNLYLETDDSGGKSKTIWIHRPGTKLWKSLSTISASTVVRGMLLFDTTLYIVVTTGSATRLYSLNSGGTLSGVLGTFSTDGTTPVSMARNANEVCMVDIQSAHTIYVYNTLTAAFSTVTAWAAPVDIVSITRSTATVTVTTDGNHGLQTGNSAAIVGALYSPFRTDYYNSSSKSVTRTGDTTLTYTITGATPAQVTRTFGSGTVVVTVTLASHGLNNGDVIQTNGFTPAAYDQATATITKVSDVIFQYSFAAGGDPGAVTVIGVVLPPTPDGTTAGVLYGKQDSFGISATHVTQMDGYFVVNNTVNNYLEGVNPQQFYISRNDDGLIWEADQYNAAQRDGDPMRVPYAVGGDLLLLGEYTTEPWYDASTGDFPFLPARAGAVQWGLRSEWTVATLGNGVAFLGQTRTGQLAVIHLEGFTPTEISSHPIAYQLRQQSSSDLDNATAFSSQNEGHWFYVLRIGTKTWAFDLTETQKTRLPAWSEWDSYSTATAAYGRFRGQFYVYAFGKHLISDYELPAINELDMATYTDIRSGTAEQIRRIGVSGAVFAEDRGTFHRRVQVDMQATGAATTLQLESSDDNGETWTDHGTTTTGPTDTRAEWFQLGYARTDRQYRITTTGAGPCIILDAYADIEAAEW